MNIALFYKKQKALIIFSFLFLIILIAAGHIPFFWTMGYIGTIANKIYESGFSRIIFPSIDNGTPPLYSVYIALAWEIFGYHLVMMHLAVMPFIIGIFIQLKKLLKNINLEINFGWLLVLIFFNPTFITTSILGSYDLSICFLMLFMMNCIISNRKNFFFYLALSSMAVLNQRGFLIVFSMFLMDLYYEARIRKNKINLKLILLIITPYFISALIFCAWIFYHKSVLGWYIVSDTFKNFHQLSGIKMLVRNLFYIFWKIFDFGQFAVWIPVLIFAFIQLFKRKLFHKENEILVLLFFSMLYYFIFLYPTSYPVSHRYFLCSHLLASISFLVIIGKKIKKIQRNLLFLLTCIILFFGNFILYPERYGNGWDSSLKVLTYFPIEKKVHEYFLAEKINPLETGSSYPMNFDMHDTYLLKESFRFSDLDDKAFDDHKFIVQSNICNTFTPEEIKNLNTKWILVKEFRSWPVYIKLFKNPEYPNENKN